MKLLIKCFSIISFYSLFLISTNLNGQYPFETCPLDSTMELELTFEIQVADFDTIYCSYLVKDPTNQECEFFMFNWKTSMVSNFQGKELFKCNPSKIKELRIFISSYQSVSETIKLDTFSFFRSFQAPQLNKLSIQFGGHLGLQYAEFNIDKWAMYDELVKSQSLKSIQIGEYILNEDWFNPFLKFKGLTEIIVKESLNIEVAALPHLKKLIFNDMYYLFSNSIINSSGMIEMPSLENSGMRSSNFYPEITFFSNSLSANIKGHPFYDINKAIQEKLVYGSNYSGIMIINSADIVSEYFNTNLNTDTIAKGMILNGEPIGVWEYKLPFFLINNEDFSYYYNYSDTSKIELPNNGEWRYNYPNGSIAIVGQFKNGLKVGKWKFYNPDGFLTNEKSFVGGKPSGLFINYEKFDRKFVENRIYFFSSKNIIHVSTFDNGIYFFGHLLNPYYPGNKYSLNAAGRLSKFKDGVFIKEIPRNSREYNKVIKMYLKKLYPEKNLTVKDILFLK